MNRRVTNFLTCDQNYQSHLQQIMPILNKSSHISLRIINYFVSNYARHNHISYQHNGHFVNDLHLSYFYQLNMYSRRNFDPFCRNNVIIQLPCGHDRYIKTTVAQLNFFKWCIQNNVLIYINNHFDDIANEMMSHYRITRKINNMKILNPPEDVLVGKC